MFAETFMVYTYIYDINPEVYHLKFLPLSKNPYNNNISPSVSLYNNSRSCYYRSNRWVQQGLYNCKAFSQIMFNTGENCEAIPSRSFIAKTK